MEMMIFIVSNRINISIQVSCTKVVPSPHSCNCIILKTAARENKEECNQIYISVFIFVKRSVKLKLNKIKHVTHAIQWWLSWAFYLNTSYSRKLRQTIIATVCNSCDFHWLDDGKVALGIHHVIAYAGIITRWHVLLWCPWFEFLPSLSANSPSLLFLSLLWNKKKK